MLENIGVGNRGYKMRGKYIIYIILITLLSGLVYGLEEQTGFLLWK